MKHILLPTDFSDNAWSAAQYAMNLFSLENTTFYFLHSTKMRVSTMSNFSNKLLKVMSENALNDLTTLKELGQSRSVNDNHDFEIILRRDDLEYAIDAVVKKYNIDLIIMGTKGSTLAKELVMGSNTIRLLKKIKTCPILIIPDGQDFEVPKQIGFPTDFNRFYGEELLPLKRFSELHKSKIRILHINEEENLTDTQNYNLAMLKAYLEEHAHTFHWVPDHGKKADEIIDFINTHDIDILAMINYKHSFMESIINEPIIKKLGFHPEVPFLVIPSAN